MTNSKASEQRQGAERFWLASLLLLAQFLTITPVLLIILADEQQRRVSDGYVSLLDGLDRLSFTSAALENMLRSGPGSTAWERQYSAFRGELNQELSNPAVTPEIRAALERVDASVQRADGRAARSELLDTERLVRAELAKTGNSIAQMTTYLKALVSGACLLLFGVVLVVRKFRRDAAIQRKLQRELETTNEEVIAALAAARLESEAKNQILGHVGHWIRRPLKAPADGSLAESLTEIADQVVDYAAIESGILELRPSEFEPARILTEALEQLRVPAERKGLRLRSEAGKPLPSALKGDSQRLRQVVVNLLSNAIRFADKGEVVLCAKEEAGAEGRTTLRFDVRSAGSGMTEDVRNRIFQPFSQLPGTQAGGEGTALGLAISKKLVEMMGGKMDVSSQAGRGCTFSFTAAFESVSSGPEPQLHPRPGPSASPAVSAVVGTGPALNGKAQAPKKGGRERRTEQRQGTNYPTLLRSEHAGVASVRILDVSPSGLRVSAPFRLDLNTEVEIRIEGMSVVGVVRNCTCIRANEFHVGIAIRPASEGDKQFLDHVRLLRAE
jgi:signal transduction histidine kinase